VFETETSGSTELIACTLEDGCTIGSIQSLEFFVIGDIGGMPIYPYYSYAQNSVAKRMKKVAEKGAPLHFVVNLGDNFYYNGIKDVSDHRFKDSFEDVYDGESLRVPWYTIAGNHDHLGNVNAQLAYTNHSRKWTFPKLFYTIRYNFNIGNEIPLSFEMLMIDTIVLCGNTVDVQGDGLFDWLFSKHKEPTGPPKEYRKLAKEQWEWIEEQLNKSTADYLFVSGHYPIYSTCEHGGIKCLQQLDRLLHKYKVNAYFSGHDHNLQHIRVKDDTGDEMNYIVSGAGSRTDRSFKHKKDVAEDSLVFRDPKGWNPFSQIGFSSGRFIHISIAENATLNFYSGKGDMKYQTIINRRK